MNNRQPQEDDQKTLDSGSAISHILTSARENSSTSAIIKKLPSLKADGWTCFTTVGDSLGALLGTGYWVGQAIDSCLTLENFVIGLSTPALISGGCVAIFATACTAYTHYILNVNHQYDELEKHAISPEDQENIKHAITIFDELQTESIQDPTTAIEKIRANISIVSTILKKYNLIQHEAKTDEPRQLTTWQKVAIAGDIVAHIGDGAATPTMIYNLAIDPSSIRIGINLTVQLGAMIFGSLNMKANIRTCIKNLHEHNKHKEEASQPNDTDEAYQRMCDRV